LALIHTARRRTQRNCDIVNNSGGHSQPSAHKHAAANTQGFSSHAKPLQHHRKEPQHQAPTEFTTLPQPAVRLLNALAKLEDIHIAALRRMHACPFHHALLHSCSQSNIRNMLFICGITQATHGQLQAVHWHATPIQCSA
jgi:hypothetical protein